MTFLSLLLKHTILSDTSEFLSVYDTERNDAHVVLQCHWSSVVHQRTRRGTTQAALTESAAH